MMEKERLCSTCQGGMTGLGDDFFDKQRLSEEELKILLKGPDIFMVTQPVKNSFFIFIRQRSLMRLTSRAKVQKQIMRVFHAQLLSKQQSKQQLSYEVLKDITLRKGAESLLYYRTAFEHPLKKGEEKMLYALGGLMQLSNDIFDVYKDHKNGISTLVTTASKIKRLRFLYSALLRIAY